MPTFTTTILATFYDAGFDKSTIDPSNDTWNAYKQLADDILADPPELERQLPEWYCRGMCFAEFIQCIWNNPTYPPRAICDSHWSQCVANCANPE